MKDEHFPTKVNQLALCGVHRWDMRKVELRNLDFGGRGAKRSGETGER